MTDFRKCRLTLKKNDSSDDIFDLKWISAFTLLGPMMCFYKGIEREVCDRRIGLPVSNFSILLHTI